MLRILRWQVAMKFFDFANKLYPTLSVVQCVVSPQNWFVWCKICEPHPAVLLEVG